MVNVNALLTSIATLYFYNDTNKIVERNESLIDVITFYVVDNDESVLPLALDSDTDIIYFPKCCPPNHVFEPESRKCVRTNISNLYNDLGLNVSIIRSGLSNCEVIVDRRVSEFKIENFSKDRKFLFDNEVFSYGKYCLDKTFDEKGYIARLCYPEKYCSTSSIYTHKDWCLKKCCHDGYVLVGKECALKPSLGLNINDNLDVIEKNDSIALFTDDRSCRRYEASKESFNFSIDANGSFLIYERKIWKNYKVDDLMYCMETSYNTTTKQSRNVFKLCVISNANDIKFKISSPAMIISCICLLITILTYVFVHKLKKIIERIIVCYCFFLMVFYVLTILVHTISDLGKYCEVVGFTLFFSYIASFSWMNVLSFDIYRTVASMKTSLARSNLFKKMLCYSVYAISIPSLVTLFLYLAIKKILEISPYLHPKLIKGKCIIIKRGLGTYGHILHSVIPVGILILLNVIFFIKTLRYYLKAKSEIKLISGVSINGKSKKMKINRQKIIMVLKLSLVMGISWIFEIVSLSVNFKQNAVLEVIEAIIDTFNYSQGLFVFLIFLVKWDILKNLLSKLKLSQRFGKRKFSVCHSSRTNSITMPGS